MRKSYVILGTIAFIVIVVGGGTFLFTTTLGVSTFPIDLSLTVTQKDGKPVPSLALGAWIGKTAVTDFANFKSQSASTDANGQVQFQGSETSTQNLFSPPKFGWPIEVGLRVKSNGQCGQLRIRGTWDQSDKVDWRASFWVMDGPAKYRRVDDLSIDENILQGTAKRVEVAGKKGLKVELKISKGEELFSCPAS